MPFLIYGIFHLFVLDISASDILYRSPVDKKEKEREEKHEINGSLTPSTPHTNVNT